MLGTFGVGKTSLVRRYVQGLFDDAYLSTIGVQVFHKELERETSQDGLKMVLWDLANIEHFTAMEKQYFRGSAGAIIVVDLSRPDTLSEKNIHIKTFLEINPDAELVFAGNKVDLIADDQNADTGIASLAGEYDSPFLLTSAKTDSNVESLFQSLGERIVEKA
jgi:small GTP-binding protein